MTDDIDAESFAAIIELQLQDIQALLKGKQREGDDPNASEAAFELLKNELESASISASDRVMCRSIASAVKTDGKAIAQHVAEEEQAVRDRLLALGKNPVSTDENKEEGKAGQNGHLNDELLTKLEALYVDDSATIVSEEAGESSAWAASRRRQCLICTENVLFVNIAKLPCSHEYCRECLTQLFESSINDESLFPPRCCSQPIPVEENRIFLSSQLVGEFRAKEIEYTTPNRTYCHEPTCSTFVPPQFIDGDVATCVKCQNKTCLRCKGAAHNEDCPQDPATQEILRMAAESGWQRCNKCRRMVELNVGCYHITCPCGAHFCYLCGVKWKKCKCQHWDERRLYNRAKDVVNRQTNGRETDAVQLAGMIRREMQNLRQNHECNHGSWRSRQGPHRCEECRHILPEYIFECTLCHIMACERCRFNRL